MSPHDSEVEIAARAIVNNVRDELLDIDTLGLETDPVIINILVKPVIASGERKDESAMACRKTNAGAIPGTDLEDTRKDWVTEVVKIFRQALPFRAAPAEKLHKAISSSLREYPHLSSECFGLLRRTIRSAIQGSSVLFPGTKSNTVNVESCSALHNPLQGSAFPVQPKVTVGINPEICSIGKEPVEQVSKGDLQQQMIGLPGSKSSFNSERLEPSDAVIAVAKNSRRGSYNCGKCRRPLKGHNCPFQKVKKVCHSKPEKSKHRKPSGQKKGKRGPYYCADCGLKKKGHICDAVEVKIILDDSSSSMDSKPKTCLPCEVVVHPVTDEETSILESNEGNGIANDEDEVGNLPVVAV